MGTQTSKIRKAETTPPTSAEICFYRANEQPYGKFSNLYRRNIDFEGQVFATAEHAYQAGKPRDHKVREWLLSAPSPALLAMAAHGLYSWDIVENWSKIKYERMRRVLDAKFRQHSDLRELLLGTGDARLVEAGRVDNAVNRTWGEVNGKGKNMLGILLMELRAELRAESRKCNGTTRLQPAARRPADGRRLTVSKDQRKGRRGA